VTSIDGLCVLVSETSMSSDPFSPTETWSAYTLNICAA
jgi:hypothetical protein